MRPILLIYIPTFNRCQSLNLCLSRLMDEMVGIEDEVRVHVSDNCSSDETNDLLKSISHPSFDYSRNSENIGGPRNYIKVYNYGSFAEYTLVIGDDDYFLGGALKKLVYDIKNNPQVDIFFINTISYPQDSYDSVLKLMSESSWRSCPMNGILKSHVPGDFTLALKDLFNPLIDEVLGGSMMCYVFRSALLRDHVSDMLDSIDFGGIYSSYPQTLNIIYSLDPLSAAAHISTPVTCNFWHHGGEWGKDAYHKVVSQGLGFLLFELRRLGYIPEEKFSIFFDHYIKIARESLMILLKNTSRNYQFDHNLLCDISFELLNRK